MRVAPYFGTKVNRWEQAVRLSPDIIENVSMEWGDKGHGVVVKVDDMRDKVKEITLDKLF